MPGTVVAVHAHPDDEALLTGGTLALLAAAGHRVVVVTATDGAAGLAASSLAAGGDLARVRAAELLASTRILGVARTVPLGYADSGLGPRLAPSDGRPRFVEVPVADVAAAIVRVLDEERPVLVTGYDPAGGYGHRDHRHTHLATRLAAAACGVRLLEATAPREPIARALRWAGRLRLLPADFDPAPWACGFSPADRITHRIDVTAHLDAKLDALAAHVSQTTGPDGAGPRTLATVLRLPRPVLRTLLGTEYFVDPRAVPARVHRDLLNGRSGAPDATAGLAGAGG